MFHESDLKDAERIKYSRQVIVPGIGISNQIKLRDASVLIVGCGGLGSPLIMYLASCGIGKLGIVDHDIIEIHNLQRQIIYKESDVGFYKVDKAFSFIRDINKEVIIDIYKTKVDYNFQFINKYDIIVDCTDSIQTRYVLSDLSKIHKKDFVCASVIRWEGHLYNFKRDGPCYRCLYPNFKKSTVSCDENGIIGPICGIFGSLLGLEVIKTIIGETKTKLIIYNGLTDKFNIYKLRGISPRCSLCNEGKIGPINEAIKVNDNIQFINVPTISWDEVISDFDRYFIIDIRNSIHFRMFRVKNSVNIPLQELQDSFKQIKTDKKVLVLCKRGISSLKAASILNNLGIKSYSINGGIEEYKKLYNIDQ